MLDFKICLSYYNKCGRDDEPNKGKFQITNCTFKKIKSKTLDNKNSRGMIIKLLECVTNKWKGSLKQESYRTTKHDASWIVEKVIQKFPNKD